MKHEAKSNLIATIIKAIFSIVLILALGYGVLLILIGTYTQHEIDIAKENYASAAVQITELRDSQGLSHSLIVVLQPVDGQSELPEQLGNTLATTSNQKLTIGDRLTMYYDPENLQERVIDFRTAKPQQHTGFLLTGLALLLLLIRIIISRNRHSHPTAIGSD